MSDSLSALLDDAAASADSEAQPSPEQLTPVNDQHQGPAPRMVEKQELGSFLDDMGKAPESDSETPEDSEGDSSSEQEQAPEKPSQEQGEASEQPSADAWTLERFLEGKIKDPKAFLDSEDQIDNFGKLKGVTSKAIAENKALTMELSDLRKQLTNAAPSEDGKAPVLPESDAVKALQAEIDALKPKAERVEQFEARDQLQHNLAFQKEYEKPRADILRDLEQTATKAGVDNPQESVADFLRMDSEYDQQKWIEQNFEDDRAAANIFGSKGGQFLKLSTERQQTLATDDPIKTLREFQDLEQAFGAQIAGKFSEGVSNQFKAALPQARQELLSEDSGDPFFFEQEAGQQVLKEVLDHFNSDGGLVPSEVIKAMAVAQSAPVYKALAERQARELKQLREEARTKAKLDPSSLGTGGGGESPDKSKDLEDVFAFSGGRKPMVTAAQLAGR